jgi:hypothetical protein
MSLDHLRQVLRRAVEDDSFAAQLATDEALLTGYDLSAEERRALLDHDERALAGMGIEPRLIDGLRVIPRRR